MSSGPGKHGIHVSLWLPVWVTPVREFIHLFAVGSHVVIIWFGGLWLRVRVMVSLGVRVDARVRAKWVSKLLG